MELVGVMDIALMNEKVVFQKCSVVKDGIGNHRNEWTEDYCCFATIGGEGLPVPGKRKLQGLWWRMWE